MILLILLVILIPCGIIGIVLGVIAGIGTIAQNKNIEANNNPKQKEISDKKENTLRIIRNICLVVGAISLFIILAIEILL